MTTLQLTVAGIVTVATLITAVGGAVLMLRRLGKWFSELVSAKATEFVTVTVKPLVDKAMQTAEGLKASVETLSEDTKQQSTALLRALAASDAQAAANKASADDREELHRIVERQQVELDALKLAQAHVPQSER